METTRLLHGLPAILDVSDQEWLVFSPYAQSVCRIPDSLIDAPETLLSLKQEGFLGQPSTTCPGASGPYYQLTLIVTSKCNLKCRYCFANSGETSLVMDLDTAQAAIRYGLEKAGDRKLLISFFGGEPTLAPKIIKESVRYAEEQIGKFPATGLLFNITTNGVINKDLLSFLIEKKFFFTISMDGTPEIQNLQRPLKNGKTSSNRVESTIKELVKKRAEFIVRMTITDQSVDSLPDAARYLASLGVTQMHCEAINLAGRALLETKGQPMKRPDPEHYADKIIETIEVGAELGISLLNSSFMNLLQPSVNFCDGIGGNRLSVTYDGIVTTCLEVQGGCHPTAAEFITGAYSPESKSLVVDPGKVLRLKTRPIIDANKQCEACFAKFICGGGCPIRNFHTSGDSTKLDDFRCRVISKVLPYVIKSLE